MALDGIQALPSSSVGSLLFQALAASGAFSVSQATQSKLAGLQEVESVTAVRLSDLATLRGLLVDLSSAAAGLRPAPTTLSSDISVDKATASSDEIELDETDAADLQTGDKIIFSGAFASASVSANTTYFVNVTNVDANSVDIKLFTSRSDALNNTNAVDITANDNSPGVTANQIIPEPESEIEALADAYNDLQEFLAEKTKEGGSLANETALTRLGSKLLAVVRPVLESAELSPAISVSGTSRKLTVDADVLSDQVDASAQSIASLFDENGSNIADGIRQLTDSFISIVDTLASTLDEQSPRVSTQIAGLLEQSEKEQATGFNNIGKIAGAISLTQIRIQFLSTL